MSKLDGKTAIITGSGRGIGRAIALKLAAEGASVVINDLDEGPSQEALAELHARGHAAHAMVGDVTAADFGDRLVAETLEKFGALDIVINNAGYIWNSAIQNHTEEFGRYNVTVNCVAYGHIATRLTEPLADEPRTIDVKGHELKVGLSPEMIALGRALTPLGRAGTLEEAAGAVYLLCIPESDFITGQILHCSGGLIL